ncbi:hypothetical protein FRB99_005219, partial [Tulasnella sp. 403]
DGVRPENIQGHDFLEPLDQSTPGVERIMIRDVYTPALKFIENRARLVDRKPTLQTDNNVFYLFSDSGVRELPSSLSYLGGIVHPGTWALVDSNVNVTMPAGASVLSSGGKFQAFKMTAEVKGSNTHWKKCAETVELELQPRRRDLFPDVNLLELDSERYYEPIAGNNRTFDSLIYDSGSDSVVTVFQVSLAHPWCQ